MSKYLHGYDESVLRSHKWRTAENSAAFLLPYLKADYKVLDVGCGPATITVDLAKNHVSKGKVVGLEIADEILELAKKTAHDEKCENVEFVKGSVYELPFDDNSFDIVFAHQVLQHLKDPVEALKAMKRVVKPGGIIAVRDCDYGGSFWYPETEGMKEWADVYSRTALSLGATPNAGRRFRQWCREAGFNEKNLILSSANWTFASPDELDWWSGLWADRTLKSEMAKTAKKNEIATKEDLERISNSWKEWNKEKDAWFCLVNGQLIYRK